MARPVADASPMAAEAAGFTAREARGNKVTRVVSPTISVRQRFKEIWLSRELVAGPAMRRAWRKDGQRGGSVLFDVLAETGGGTGG